MGSMKLDVYCASKNFQQAVETTYNAAFGPSPALYRQISLCGWRPLAAHRKPYFLSSTPLKQGAPPSEESNASGIEVYETSKGMTIEVALSAIKEDSLHLAITGKMVIIRGERILLDQEEKTLSAGLARNSQFQHFIQLPATVRTGGFRAQLKGDVVQIDFSKRR